MGLLRRLLGSKVKIRGFMVIDLSDETLKLPSGKRIPIRNVIKIDTEHGVIIYKDRTGEIKEEPFVENKLSEELENKIKELAREERPLGVYA